MPPLVILRKAQDCVLPGNLIAIPLPCQQLSSRVHLSPRSFHFTVKDAEQYRRQMPTDKQLVTFVVVHRDGTYVKAKVELKPVESSIGVFDVWVTYDSDVIVPQHEVMQLDLKPMDQLGWPERQIAQCVEMLESNGCIHLSTHAGPSIEKSMNIALTHHGQTCAYPADFHHYPSFCPIAPSSSKAAGAIGLTGHPFNAVVNHLPTAAPSLGEPLVSFYAPIECSAVDTAPSIDDYVILDTIGKGAYSQVKLAFRKNDPTQKKVVIKFVVKSLIPVDRWAKDRQLGVIPVEIHILHTLRKIPHENCSEMLDYFEDDDYYYIIMGPHGAGMDLFDYIEMKNGMMDDEIQRIFKQVAEAVRHLHAHKIVHRDIKDENVVLDAHGGVQLIDFGSAAYLKGHRFDTFAGTLDYAAPEILLGSTYDGPPQDIWALGILLYTLVYRENPFYDVHEILNRDLRVPFVHSPGCLNLIRKMLNRNINRRPTIHQVLAHPWLNADEV